MEGLDRQNEERINRAAEQFADAYKESFRVVSERGVSAQEFNAQVTQNFFNNVISNLRGQADSNRQMAQELAGQQQRQAEATQQLTQESVSAYMDFINSMFSYAQGNLEQTQQQAQQAQREARQ